MTGCGHECKSYAAFGLVVVVQDASGSRICDAKVVAIDGSYSATLQSSGGDATICTYFGATERGGTYEVDATVGDTTSTVRGVRVTSNDCRVVPSKLTITIAA